MAINKNHEFEELDGVKCAVVEKNASQERLDFLKDLLVFNKYTVVVTASTPPKPPAAPAPKPVTEGEQLPPPPETPVSAGPPTFTIGVTDVRFNATNAIFGRMLRTKDGRIVTLAYWQQKENVSNDEVPYYEKKV